VRVVLRPLSPPSKILRPAAAIEVLAAYVEVRLLLGRRGLPATVQAIRSRRALAGAGPDPVANAIRLANRVVRALAPVPADSRCLVRSLVVMRLLASRGISGRLILGVRTEPSFEAHAWVAVDGVEILPSGGEAFGRLAEL
jgi:hypothetical protein